jgi:hypothetical protein
MLFAIQPHPDLLLWEKAILAQPSLSEAFDTLAEYPKVVSRELKLMW